MISTVFWLIAIGPLGLMGLGFTPPTWAHCRLQAIHVSARLLAAWGTLTSLLVLAWAASGETLRTPLVGAQGLGLSLYLDVISASMFALVSFIGLVVIVYSRNYLAGDPGQGRFMKWISLTLGSVLLLIIAGNLLHFFLAWVSTSLCLHRLLTFYPERPAAILAARKKWVVSRIGDLCLFSALVLLYRLLGTLDYSSIFFAAQSARATGESLNSLLAIAALFAFAALLKSAQFPVHGWLLEVMETPTPVSALLHAGIINAGGFLLVRFCYLLSLSPFAMNTLVIVGTATAIFGSLVMLTQTSVKVSLAYSTIAQMGFMMLECGLGVFSAAMLHIIAHSLYKAHAFLSSGDAAREAERPAIQSPIGQGSVAAAVAAMLIVLVTVTIVGAALGSTLLTQPGTSTLSYIFAFGLAVLLANGFEGGVNFPFLLRVLAGVVGVTTFFYATQFAAAAIFEQAVPAPPNHALNTLGLVLRVGVILVFGVAVVLQSVLRELTLSRDQRKNEIWLAFYIHLLNGFYINTIVNRLVIRFWPSPAPRLAAPSYLPTYQKGAET